MRERADQRSATGDLCITEKVILLLLQSCNTVLPWFRLLRDRFTDLEEQGAEEPALSVFQMTSALTRSQAAKLFYQICGMLQCPLLFCDKIYPVATPLAFVSGDSMLSNLGRA